MRLPNGHRAFVDIRKLRDYCLSMGHPRGRHKARVFKAVLGLTAADAEMLRQTLLAAAAMRDTARQSEADEYGLRCVLELSMVGMRGEATIRSSWIIRHDEDFPRLTSCYVL